MPKKFLNLIKFTKPSKRKNKITGIFVNPYFSDYVIIQFIYDLLLLRNPKKVRREMRLIHKPKAAPHDPNVEHLQGLENVRGHGDKD